MSIFIFIIYESLLKVIILFFSNVLQTNPTENDATLSAIKFITSFYLLYQSTASRTPLKLVSFVITPTEIISGQAFALMPFSATTETHVGFATWTSHLSDANATRFVYQIITIWIGAPFRILRLFFLLHLVVLVHFFVNSQLFLVAKFFYIRNLKS